MIKEGTKVTWEWGSGTAEGTVIETYTRKVEKEIEIRKITNQLLIFLSL